MEWFSHGAETPLFLAFKNWRQNSARNKTDCGAEPSRKFAGIVKDINVGRFPGHVVRHVHYYSYRPGKLRRRHRLASVISLAILLARTRRIYPGCLDREGVSMAKP